MKAFLIGFLFLTFIGPLWIFASRQIDFTADWRTADRQSAKISPDAKTTSEAVIQAYSAKAFNWRGLFSVHTWIAVKPKNATHYKVYQIVGWRLWRGLPALMAEEDIPDRNWFAQSPKLFYELRGDKAQKLIPKIDAEATHYPYASEYKTLPGPNSNTFPAYIARKIPELGLTLPSNAIGKDFLGLFTFFAPAPSHTGYQFSLFGLLGLTIAKKEGFELNFLGLVYGFNPFTLQIKLPGIGEWPCVSYAHEKTDF